MGTAKISKEAFLDFMNSRAMKAEVSRSINALVA
jgi:hypothetical protein